MVYVSAPSAYVFVAGIVSLSMTLSGCGSGSGSGGSGPRPFSTPAPTPLPEATNIWQWRSDMIMGKQITYDLSAKLDAHCLYGGCWRDKNVETLAGGNYVQYGPVDQQFKEDNQTYGTYNATTGVTLLNLRNSSSKPGCLMRKSRLPIDLSKIKRIELDLESSGSTGRAPWYSVWLAPMVYADTDDNAKAAEIDIVENYDQNGRGSDVNSVASNFAQCGDIDYTMPYCQPSYWGAVATTLNHHITLEATEEGSDGRVIRVYRCQNPPSGPKLTTCKSGDFSQIYVTKPGPPNVPKDKWFKVWNKEVAGKHYAHYWLVTDMWWTSNTDFKLSVENIHFFNEDDTEWTMDLKGSPPTLFAFNGSHEADIVV